MKQYHLVSSLHLEWFDDEALLLVADQHLLLTVNAAAATLFESLSAFFAGRTFTLAEGVEWLDRHYELTAEACRQQARGLLAFALKYHLAVPVKNGGNA